MGEAGALQNERREAGEGEGERGQYLGPGDGTEVTTLELEVGDRSNITQPCLHTKSTEHSQ